MSESDIVWPVLGEFDKVRKLNGGIGLVFVARHVHDGFLVVVKTLADYSDIRAVRAFEHEARVWLAIPGHPSVLPVIRVDRDGTDRPFVVTLHVENGDLQPLIGQAPLTKNVARVLSLAIQMCDGLIHAYHHSIDLHGDIKPANCLRLTNDRILLADFGMARAKFAASGGSAGGTPEYLAPEQTRDFASAGPPVDVYSLGAMIVEMVTGSPPFGRISDELNDAGLAQRHAEETPRFNLKPKPLSDLAHRCLLKDPRCRPPIGELRDELCALYKQVSTRPHSPPSSSTAANSALTHLLRGMSFKELPEGLEQAEMSFKAALELEPENVDALAQLADCLRSQKRLDEALEYAKSATRIDPNDAQAWDIQGSILHEMDNRDEAKKCFQRSITIDPTTGLYHYNFAVLIDETDPAEAKAAYRTAIEMDQDLAEAWCNLGVLLENDRDLDGAERCYRHALAIKPHLLQPMRGLIDVLRKTERLDEADEPLHHAIEVAPNDGSLKALQINLLVERGKVEEAQRLFDIAHSEDTK